MRTESSRSTGRRKEQRKIRDRSGSGTPDMAVRARLLQAAIKLFSTKGYSATTTREIVASAGVTKPVLYYYFKNKEGIYLELMREPSAKFLALVENSGKETGSPAAKILRLCDRLFTLFSQNLNVIRLIYSVYYGPPQGAPFVDFDAFHLQFHDAIRVLLEEGIRTGEFRRIDLEEATWAILGAVNIIMETELCHPEMKMGRASLRRILKLIFRSVLTPKALAGLDSTAEKVG